MTGLKTVRVQAAGAGSSLRLNLPRAWTDALEIEPGQQVELEFDDVLVVVPRRSPQAERVLRGMAEVG